MCQRRPARSRRNTRKVEEFQRAKVFFPSPLLKPVMQGAREGVAIYYPPPLRKRISRFTAYSHHRDVNLSFSSLPMIHPIPRPIRSTRGRMEFQPHPILISRTSKMYAQEFPDMRSHRVGHGCSCKDQFPKLENVFHLEGYPTHSPHASIWILTSIPSKCATPKAVNARSGANIGNLRGHDAFQSYVEADKRPSMVPTHLERVQMSAN